MRPTNQPTVNMAQNTYVIDYFKENDEMTALNVLSVRALQEPLQHMHRVPC